MMPKKTDTESRCTMDKKARKASEARHFRISGGILVVGLLLLLPVVNAAGNTNISILYGYNGTTYVPLLTDGAGHLQTVMNLTSSAGLNPITNNTYDLGATSLLWANVYARSIRSSGTLSLFGGTTEAMTILGGNVGIGTTGPGQLLHVSSVATGVMTMVESTNANGFPSLALKNPSQTWNIYNDGSLAGASDNGLGFYAGGYKLYIQTDGNVGIGTTAPMAQLHLNNPTNGEAINISRGTGSVRLTKGINSDNLFLFNNDASINLMTWLGTGNVGIGTTNPGNKLDIRGTNTLVTIGNSGVAGERLELMYNSTDNYSWIRALGTSGNYGNLAVQPDGGNVGIGTTGPNGTLHAVLPTAAADSDNAFVVWDWAGPDTSPFVIKGDGRAGNGVNGFGITLHRSGGKGVLYASSNCVADGGVSVGDDGGTQLCWMDTG